MSRDWSTAREFGRSMQGLHLLQEAQSGDLSGDDILFLMNVNEIPADAQPKKVTVSGLADASGPFVVAGSNTQIQYNDNGDFGASADLTWDDSAKELGVGGDINLDDGGTYETTVQVVTPTANRTISFPDATGTVALVAGSSGQLIWNSSGAQAGVTGSTVDGSGNVTLTSVSTGLGTAGAPTHSFTGDPNTGIYSPGADQVAISTNGTGRLFVDANGNVAIGNSSANNRFLVYTVGANDSYLQIGNGSTGIATTQGLRLGTPAAGNAEIITDGLITFGAGNIERARITSDGKLGLGTSSPGFKLTIEDSTTPRIRIGDGVRHVNLDGGSATQNAAVGTDYTGSFGIYTNGAENTRLHITSAGLVGIGTTSPNSALDIRGDFTFASSDAAYGTNYYGVLHSENAGDTGYLQFRGASDLGKAIGVAGFGTETVLFAGSTERARIDSSGRLLVGTSTSYGVGSSAAAKLQTGDTSGGLAASFTSWSSFDDGGIIALGKAKGGSVGNYTILSNGDTVGQIRFAAADGTDLETNAALIQCQIDGTPGANDMPGRLVFSTTADGASSPTERMRIDSAGIVYIRESDGTAGAYHQMDASANYRIGNNSGGSGNYVYLAPGGTSWVGVSDERLKTALVEIQDGLSKVSTLRAVTGRYTDDPETESRSFLIAQDVAAVLPEAVDAANPEQLGLRYTDTIPLLVAALKEAKEKIETLEAKVAALETQ